MDVSPQSPMGAKVAGEEPPDGHAAPGAVCGGRHPEHRRVRETHSRCQPRQEKATMARAHGARRRSITKALRISALWLRGGRDEQSPSRVPRGKENVRGREAPEREVQYPVDCDCSNVSFL